MSIRQYLNGQRFDFETTRVLGIALEMSRWALRFEERGEGTDEIIAKHIIELAQAGERDADRLCDYALAKLREADGRPVSSSPPPRPVPRAQAKSSDLVGSVPPRYPAQRGANSSQPGLGDGRPVTSAAQETLYSGKDLASITIALI